MVIQTKSCMKDSHLGATHTIAPKSNLTVLKTSFKTLCKSFAPFTFQVIDHWVFQCKKLCLPLCIHGKQELWKFLVFLISQNRNQTSKFFDVDPKGNNVNVKFYFNELCKYFCPRTLNCPLKVIELICILSDFFLGIILVRTSQLTLSDIWPKGVHHLIKLMKIESTLLTQLDTRTDLEITFIAWFTFITICIQLKLQIDIFVDWIF